MDGTTIIVVISLFALVVVASLLVFRKRGRFIINAREGKVDIDATNEATPPPPGVRIRDAKSRQGGLLVEQNTGQTIDLEQIEVDKDILVSNEEKKTTDAP